MENKMPTSEQLDHFREQLDQTHENFGVAHQVKVAYNVIFILK